VGGMQWMHLTHDGVRFGVALNMVMNRVTCRATVLGTTIC